MAESVDNGPKRSSRHPRPGAGWQRSERTVPTERPAVIPASLLTGAALLCSVALAADAPVDAPGKALFEAGCVSCHQTDGRGLAAMKAPAIAALDQDYVQRQLTSFRAGARTLGEDETFARTMVALVQGLSDTDVGHVSAYVASLPPAPVVQELSAPGLAARGLYSGCSSCHGPHGQGTPALGAPRIAGQHRWYLKEQLHKFRDGRRGADPADTRGQQMRAMALAIASDADIDILANYIAGLEP